MTRPLVHGDHASCSRIGGAMRREASRLRQHAQSLEEAVGQLGDWRGPEADIVHPAIAASLQSLRAAAGALDEAGAAVQRYAMDLAEGHELGRRAELRVQDAGLLLDRNRVVEPWGPAGMEESEQRRDQRQAAQARVDLATAHIGRARGRLRREMDRLGQSFPGPEPAVGSTRGPGNGPVMTQGDGPTLT